MLSRETPRLLTWGEGDTVELSMVREELSTLNRVDLVDTPVIVSSSSCHQAGDTEQ